jgi:FMN reductase
LDFTQFLGRDDRPYLEDRVVGLISTAGGDRAAANTTDAMVHVVHALRGAWKRFDNEWNVTDEGFGERLSRLGRLVVDMAGGLGSSRSQGDRRAETVGVAV